MWGLLGQNAKPVKPDLCNWGAKLRVAYSKKGSRLAEPGLSMWAMGCILLTVRTQNAEALDMRQAWSLMIVALAIMTSRVPRRG